MNLDDSNGDYLLIENSGSKFNHHFNLTTPRLLIKSNDTISLKFVSNSTANTSEPFKNSKNSKGVLLYFKSKLIS